MLRMAVVFADEIGIGPQISAKFVPDCLFWSLLQSNLQSASLSNPRRLPALTRRNCRARVRLPALTPVGIVVSVYDCRH
jgi:hypothetical protein